MPDRWYAPGLRFACTQCGNCCKTHGSYAFVYLAEADVQAISGYLELDRVTFLERHCREQDGWITLRIDEPACPFLDSANRCTIYPVRPKQCRTWPFWKENLKPGAWQGPVSDCCPGIDDGPLHSADEVDRIAAETEAWYEA